MNDDGCAREAIFGRYLELFDKQGLAVREVDDRKPWGGYIRLAEESLSRFQDLFWEGCAPDLTGRRCDPKVLLVAPTRRLSLQLHHRRAEWWRVVEGPVSIVLAAGDGTLQTAVYPAGSVVRVPREAAHRLQAGAADWGCVAEIWEHDGDDVVSDEQDIVRLDDDFGRQ